jgi:hypothetical protein
MNRKSILSSLFGGLAVVSGSTMATGFVTLPSNGVPVSGGTSAYATCNLTGNFGSNPLGSTPPTFSPNGGANNTCAVPSNNPPLTGYSQVVSTVRNIVINNVAIGTVTDRVFRNAAATSCIYAAKIRLNGVDYNPSQAGAQYYEVNDFQRAGFRNRGPIAAAYNFVTRGGSQSDEVLYRVGLTKTAVVHQPGGAAQPLTSVAPISTNWVDFTSDVNFMDPDGSSMRDSPWFYVKSGCTSAAPTAVTGALRFRQMGQEGQPNLEISVPGYAPAGANTTP